MVFFKYPCIHIVLYMYTNNMLEINIFLVVTNFLLYSEKIERARFLLL